MKCLRNAMLLGALALSPAVMADTYLTLGYGMSSWSDRDDDDTGLSSQVGLDIGVNDWLSVEAAYYYLGETSSISVRDVIGDAPNGQTPPTIPDVKFTKYMRGNSLAVSAIGRLALSENFTLMGKAGIEKWDVSSKEQSVRGTAITEGEDGFAPLLGVGASYALSGQVHTALWFDFHSFDGDVIKQDIISANFRVYFRF